MNRKNLGFQNGLASRSARIAGRAVTTIAIAGAAASGAEATIVTFGAHGVSTQSADNPVLISLAGSSTPLYSLTYTEGSNSFSQPMTSCTEVIKFGGCNRYYTYDQVTTTHYNYNNFTSLSPDALIGERSAAELMPTADEHFTTDPASIRSYELRTVSGQPYTGIPFTPQPTQDSPLYDGHLHLKFAVDGVDYLGVATFIGAGLGSIEYEAVAGTSAVPEADSWMMLIAGFGLTGAAVRRSRARLQAAA